MPERPVPPQSPPELPRAPRITLNPHEVIETPYVPAGAGMQVDTTDAGWVKSRLDTSEEPLPPPPRPLPRNSNRPVIPKDDTPKFYPGFGVVEEEAATVRYQDYDDDGIGFGRINDLDGGGPPTDEVPSAVLQDVSHGYSAPMNVPEPPPLPGILDRFTPAGMARRGGGRPSYLSDAPAAPPPVERMPRMPSGSRRDDDREESALGFYSFAFMSMMLMGGLVVLLCLFMLGLYAKNNWAGSAPTAEPTPTVPVAAPVVPSELEGQNGVKVKVSPGLNDLEPPTPSPEAPSPDPVTPKPVDRPAQRPTPRPPPAPVAPVAASQELGTLNIRSNRQALVYVDGKAIGLTPTKRKVEPGARKIRAMLPNQPASEQSKTVTVTAGGSVPVNFTF